MSVDVVKLAGFFIDRIGCADTRDDIFSLRVGQPLAVEFVFAGGGITGESDAGGGIFAHVAENHRLDIDRRAPIIGNAFNPAVRYRAFSVPAFEDRADCTPTTAP